MVRSHIIALLCLLLCAGLAPIRAQVSLEFARLLHEESRTLSEQYRSALAKLEAELAAAGDYQGCKLVKARIAEMDAVTAVLSGKAAPVEGGADAVGSAAQLLQEADANLSRALVQSQLPLLQSRLGALEELAVSGGAQRNVIDAQVRHLRGLIASQKSGGGSVLSRLANQWSQPVSAEVLSSAKWVSSGEDIAHISIESGGARKTLELAWVSCPDSLATGRSEFARNAGVESRVEREIAAIAVEWMKEHISAQDLSVVMLQPQEKTEHSRCLLRVAGLGWIQEALVSRGLALVAEITAAESGDPLLRSWHQSLQRAQELARNSRRGVWALTMGGSRP
jgi:endonuclease YncB( thermonuclease family)